jgi:Peptidase family M1 domain
MEVTCSRGRMGYNTGEEGVGRGGLVTRKFLFSGLLVVFLLSACAPVARPAPGSATAPGTATVANTQAVPTAPTASPLPPTMPTTRTPAPWDEWATYLSVFRSEAKPAEAALTGLTQYHLDVRLEPDGSQVSGKANIRYTNREQVPLDVVYLHLFPNLWNDGMTVSNAQVAGHPVSVSYPSGDDIVGLPLSQPLQPGESVELSLQFATPIPHGEGAGNYGELANQDDILALAHFYPTVVVYDNGWRLETPSSQGDVIYHDASLYDVTLTTPDGMTVVATGTTLDKVDNKDGTATWRLAGGPMRDFNVVASGKYQSASKQVDDVVINSYFLPDDAAGGKQALDWAAAALQTFEEKFGPYPYRELDITSTSTSAGGIEYPGMVVVASRLSSDLNGRAFFEGATVHEVAHQWWYNVVGNDQVNQPWLDEGLAQYSTYLYFRDAYGEPGAKGFEDSLRRRWERVGFEEKPVGLAVGDYQGNEYGAIVYGRAALFFIALRDQIGEKQMGELLRRYYSEFAWRVATSEEFQALAERVSRQDLSALFNKWVYPQ